MKKVFTFLSSRLCNEYQSGGYGDWYLFSKYELNLLLSQRNAVGGFVSGYYWSSNEFDKNNAWMQGSDDGVFVNITLMFRRLYPGLEYFVVCKFLGEFQLQEITIHI